MSDEEKKAIEYYSSYVKTMHNEIILNGHIKTLKVDYPKLKTLLNLIEKQSKEIEEYNKQLDLDYVDKHYVPIERYNQLEKEIEELKENNKTLKNLQNDTSRLYIEMIERKNYFERKVEKLEDKIKAKIEELKFIADNGANAVRFAMTHDDEVERIQKQKDISTMIDILQSLLEKE